MRQDKRLLRAAIRAKKRAMAPEDIQRRSHCLCLAVLQSYAYKAAHSLYGYLPFNQEVDILPLLRQALLDGKQVALPKCFGHEMRFISVSDLSRIQYTHCGVPEPVDDGPIAQDETALVLVPGLAFDSRGYRIGYGGGYYDRFLTAEPNHPTIALCYSFQYLEQLDPEPHDIPVDTIFRL